MNSSRLFGSSLSSKLFSAWLRAQVNSAAVGANLLWEARVTSTVTYSSEGVRCPLPATKMPSLRVVVPAHLPEAMGIIRTVASRYIGGPVESVEEQTPVAVRNIPGCVRLSGRPPTTFTLHLSG